MINPSKIVDAFREIKEFYLDKNDSNKIFISYFEKNWINQKSAKIPLKYW
jgi:hypothetical protein